MHSSEPGEDRRRTRAVLFAGHRVDAPDRAAPRFPNTDSAIREAERRIDRAVGEQRENHPLEALHGWAGGANGGDLLFHSVCLTHGIPSTLLLALDPLRYTRASVEDGGDGWSRRFRQVEAESDVVVRPSGDPTSGGSDPSGPDYWNEANVWMLQEVANASDELAVMVFSVDRPGDGDSVTDDLARRALRLGAEVVWIDARGLTERA